MTVQLIACAVVVCGCAYLGVLFSDSFRKRVRQLEEFCLVVKQLEYDIDFLNTPLGESLIRLSGMCEGGVSDVLKYVGNNLSGAGCVEMLGLWKKAFDRFEKELALTEDDKRIIFDFTKNLGCGDRIREKNNIKAAEMRLNAAREDAAVFAATNVKMYRGLGILAGIFIVIVLL